VLLLLLLLLLLLSMMQASNRPARNAPDKYTTSRPGKRSIASNVVVGDIFCRVIGWPGSIAPPSDNGMQ
jgi:hypothetical protein